MENEKYAVMSKWSDKYTKNGATFVILWSDKTWEEFEIETLGYGFKYDPDKVTRDEIRKYGDPKKLMYLSYVISKHLSRKDFIDYINKKQKEIREFKKKSGV